MRSVKKSIEKKKRVSRVKKDPVAAQGSERFWVAHGPVLADLRDLAEALGAMNDEQFFHHVTPERNDFSLWTMEVLGDEATARALAQADSKTSAHKIVVKALKLYVW